MLLKLRGFEGRILESEVDTKASFGVICNQAGKDFGYHGRFTLRLPSGHQAPSGQNLEDNREFMAQNEGYIFDLVQEVEEVAAPPEPIVKPFVAPDKPSESVEAVVLEE